MNLLWGVTHNLNGIKWEKNVWVSFLQEIHHMAVHDNFRGAILDPV